MLLLNKIEIEQDINKYRENIVILWGFGKFGQKILNLFNYFNIDIYAFCDNNQKKWGG